MKTDPVQQEILLITNTTFSKRQLSGRDTFGRGGHLSPTEQLEDACWNGLLNELLPEVIEKQSPDKEIYLWQILHGRSFLEIIFSEFPASIENEFSLYPHFFMHTTNCN